MTRTEKFFTARTLLPLSLAIFSGVGLALLAVIANPAQLKAGSSQGPAAIETLKPLSASPGIRLTSRRMAEGNLCFTAQRNASVDKICTH